MGSARFRYRRNAFACTTSAGPCHKWHQRTEAGGFNEAHVTQDDGAVKGVASTPAARRHHWWLMPDHGPLADPRSSGLTALARCADAVHRSIQPLQRMASHCMGMITPSGGGQHVDGDIDSDGGRSVKDVVIEFSRILSALHRRFFLHNRFSSTTSAAIRCWLSPAATSTAAVDKAPCYSGSCTRRCDTS